MKPFHLATLACLVAAIAGTIAAHAAENAPATPIKPTEYNLGTDKLAIAGYDPVSYFTGKPAEGKKELALTLDGIVYRFTTEENRKTFAADPAKYKPAYGGWCATAMAEGRKVEIDPTNYKITNGRLFLFFKAWYANALTDWNKNEKGNISKADAAWKKIAGE